MQGGQGPVERGERQDSRHLTLDTYQCHISMKAVCLDSIASREGRAIFWCGLPDLL